MNSPEVIAAAKAGLTDIEPTHIAIPAGCDIYVQPSSLTTSTRARGLCFYDWWRDDQGRLTLHKRHWLMAGAES